MARPRSDLRDRLIASARQLFLLYGVDGASLRDIARAAGTNVGMIYYYFPSKDELFEAVIADFLPVLVERIGVALAPDAPLAERFERLFLNFGRMSDEELVSLRLILREILVSSERRQKVVALAGRAHVPLILGAVLEGLRTGDLDRQHHPGVLMISLLGTAMFAQLVRRLAGDQLPPGLEIPAGADLGRALAHLWLDGAGQRPT
jgi:AcrR family transcriptional regulator